MSIESSYLVFEHRPELRATFDKYLVDAACTDGDVVYPVDRTFLHGAIGICGEIGELAFPGDPKNLREEIGDTLWYLSRVCVAFGKPMPFPKPVVGRTDADLFGDIVEAGATILDQAKRALFYGAVVNEQKVMDAVQSLVDDLHVLAVTKGDTTLDALMAANIAKLKARYPNKFTQESALNRDTVAEMVQHDAAL